jgi:hypothetical protein
MSKDIVADYIRRAREEAVGTLAVLDERGWCKGSQDDEGRVCIVTALMRHLGLDEEGAKREFFGGMTPFFKAMGSFQQVVMALFPDRWVWGKPVASFNDHPDTTEEDVRRVLRTVVET